MSSHQEPFQNNLNDPPTMAIQELRFRCDALENECAHHRQRIGELEDQVSGMLVAATAHSWDLPPWAPRYSSPAYLRNRLVVPAPAPPQPSPASGAVEYRRTPSPAPSNVSSDRMTELTINTQQSITPPSSPASVFFDAEEISQDGSLGSGASLGLPDDLPYAPSMHELHSAIEWAIANADPQERLVTTVTRVNPPPSPSAVSSSQVDNIREPISREPPLDHSYPLWDLD